MAIGSQFGRACAATSREADMQVQQVIEQTTFVALPICASAQPIHLKLYGSD